MMTCDLSTRRVAVLVANKVDAAEVDGPCRAVLDRGAAVDVLASTEGLVRTNGTDEIEADARLADADPERYHAAIIPGGEQSAEQLATNKTAVAFVSACAELCTPIAAISHGPLVLAKAGLVPGRRLTSHRSVRTILEDAGAEWIDQEVVTDRLLTTSRGAEDLEAFSAAVIIEIAKAMTADQETG